MKYSEKQVRNIIKESLLDTLKSYFGYNTKEKKRKPRGPISAQENIGLYFEATKRQGIFVLYQKILPDQEITDDNYTQFQKAIGFLRFLKTEKPCIPQTIEVKSIAVSKEYQGKGYGSLLYGLVFQYAKDNNLGVTSDHTSSTTDDAAKFWSSLEASPDFIKKSTAGGSWKFDYDNSTKDPDDDCGSGRGVDYMATDHSWVVTHDKFKAAMNKLISVHQAHIENLAALTKNERLAYNLKSKVEKNLRIQGAEVFSNVYQNE